MLQLCRSMGALPPHRLLLYLKNNFPKYFQELATTATSVEEIKPHSKRDLYYTREVPAFSNPYLTVAN